MSYKEEFPNFSMPEVVIKAIEQGVIEDISWHNDAMPSFEFKDGRILWVDFDDEGKTFEDGKRFHLTSNDDTSIDVGFDDESKLAKYLKIG